MRQARQRFAWPLALVLTAALACLATVLVVEQAPADDGVQQRTLHSTVLREARGYFVHLPDNYDAHPTRRYPVIYVLDGHSQSAHTAGSAAVMARMGAFPESIVVGVPNTSGPGRNRDYTPPGMRQDGDAANSPEGEADRFLDFLRRELIPAIEGEFRASRTRILAGYSRGGLFVVYALIADPGLFTAFHAHSPALWRDEAAMLRSLESYFRAHPSLVGRLFLSLGSRENSKMTGAFQGAIVVLRQAPPGLRWRAIMTEGASHDDNAERSTPAALQWTRSLIPAS
jgi:predicted alpha/beta superfamily hydrolase